MCNSSINRGEEITQCLESGGMELRKVPYTGSRWVHMYCLPKDVITKYFLDVAEELHQFYPDEEFGNICDMVENHDYWTREEDNLPGISIPPYRPPTPLHLPIDHQVDSDDEDELIENGISIIPYRPPTPPHPASNDHVDSDDENEEIVVNGIFGPLKVDPIEKAEFEKTVDKTLKMLNEREKERLVKVNSPIPYNRSVCGADQHVPAYLKSLFDTPFRVIELERQKNISGK